MADVRVQATLNTSFESDIRWGGSFGISDGTIDVSQYPISASEWTLELWLWLINDGRLLKFNDEQDTTIRYSNTKLTISHSDRITNTTYTSQLAVPNGIWFQLAISKGKLGKINGMTNVYINGKNALELPHKLLYGVTLKNFKIGSGNGSRNKKRNKNTITSMLGRMKIYDRPLDEYEVLNNFYSCAKFYSISPETLRNPVKYGLVASFIAERMFIKNNRWIPEKEIIVDNMNKTDDIANLLSSLGSDILKDVKMDCVTEKPNPATDIDSILTLLNKNPEYFLSLLKKQNMQDSLMLTRQSAEPNDFDSIFINPLKSKLLAQYLTLNPQKFLELIQSGKMRPDHLEKLWLLFRNSINSGIIGGKTGIGTGTGSGSGIGNGTLGGGRDGSPMINPRLYQALGLLEFKHNKNKHQQKRHKKHIIKSGSQYDDNLMLSHDHFVKLIKKINSSQQASSERIKKLEKILAKQQQILGLMINPQGQCFGMIDQLGKIHQKSASFSFAPMHQPSAYEIIMNSNAYQHQMQRILERNNVNLIPTVQNIQSIGIKIVGQYINRVNHVVGLMIQKNDEASFDYIPVVESAIYNGIPVIGIIDVNMQESRASSNPAPETENQTRTQQEHCEESISKCPRGYSAEFPSIAKANWLN